MSDLKYGILDNMVESVVKKSKNSLNNKLSAEVGLNKSDMTNMHVKENSLGITTANYSEKVLKVNTNKSNDQSLGSKILAGEKSDCSDLTNANAIETAVNIKKNKIKIKEVLQVKMI